MKCETPYLRRLGKWEDFYQEFPCGRCLQCRINRAEEWSFRIRVELEDKTKDGDFITLTLDDGRCCPLLPQALSKRILQNFFKRLRKAGNRIRYFAAGEYGEKFGRAHYHAIIIRPRGIQPDYQKAWPLGLVHQGSVSTASVRYVTGYLTKATAIPPGRNKWPPFQLQSQGFGKEWVEKHATKHQVERENKGWIPKYFRDKISDLPLLGDLSKRDPLDLLILAAEGKVKRLHSVNQQNRISQPSEITARQQLSKAQLRVSKSKKERG